MKKSKLLGLSFAIVGIAPAAIGSISCSCGNGESSNEIKPTLDVANGKATYTKISLNKEFTVTYTPDDGYEMDTITITIGSKVLEKDADDGYTVNGNVIIVKAAAVKSSKITIKITAKQAFITEPETGEQTKACELIEQYMDTQTYTTYIRYEFTFPGIFKINDDTALNDVSLSATLVDDSSNEPTVFEMNVKMNIVDSSAKTFKITLWKDFVLNSSQGSMQNIPANTKLSLQNLTFTAGEKTHNCKCENYNVTIVPTIGWNRNLWGGEVVGDPIKLDVKNKKYTPGGTSLVVYNKDPSIIYPGEQRGESSGVVIFDFKDGSSWIQSDETNKWFVSTSGNDHYVNSYNQQGFVFDTLGDDDEVIGFRFMDTNKTTTYFSKKIGVGVDIKLHINS